MLFQDFRLSWVQTRIFHEKTFKLSIILDFLFIMASENSLILLRVHVFSSLKGFNEDLKLSKYYWSNKFEEKPFNIFHHIVNLILFQIFFDTLNVGHELWILIMYSRPVLALPLPQSVWFSCFQPASTSLFDVETKQVTIKKQW